MNLECIDEVQCSLIQGIWLPYLLWVPCFEEVVSIVDKIMPWERVHGSEWLEKRMWQGHDCFFPDGLLCEKRAELCCAAPQDIARTKGVHGGRFWLHVEETVCQ